MPRLNMDVFNTGVQMGSQSNSIGNAMRGVVQRYKDLRTQREAQAGELSLYKEKLKAEYGMKEDKMKSVLDKYGGSGRYYAKPNASGDLTIGEMFTPEKLQQVKGALTAGGYIYPEGQTLPFNERKDAENFLLRELGPDWANYDSTLKTTLDAKWPEEKTTEGTNPFAGFGAGIKDIVSRVGSMIPGAKAIGGTGLPNIGGVGKFKTSAPTGNTDLRNQAIQALNEAGYPVTENNINAAISQLSE